MSADLVKRLRESDGDSALMTAAAQCIELLKHDLDCCFISHLRDNARVKLAEERIEELERELAKLGRDYDECRGEFDKAASELAAEKALADRLLRRLLSFNDSKFWVQSDEDVLNAYRKARGL